VNFYQRDIGGALRGGEGGVRLLQPAGAPAGAARLDSPALSTEAEWIAVPLHHLFGSEELSALAPAVAERAPAPHATLHPDDAKELGLAEGDQLEIGIGDLRWQLPVRLLPMARRVIGVSVGMVPAIGASLPAVVSVRRTS
jgi:NADH-quinone oxidoreductase subunit G